jgi:mycothiol system anti-sigma-R factor
MSFSERMKRLLWGSEVSASVPAEEDEPSPACKKLTCMEALERVHEYLDGELDDISHEEVAQHFSMCKKCYPHLRLEEQFRSLLHRSQEGEVCPDHLKEQVLELLAAEAQESG